MVGTKWERFLARLDEHGITTSNGNDPITLADGIAEAVEIIESYELQFEQVLLYTLLSTEQMKKWKQACDRQEEINEIMRKELHQIPHKIIQKMRAEGLTPPKGISKAVPKKFETLDPKQVYMAEKLRKEARDNQKVMNGLNPVPQSIFDKPKPDTVMGRAVIAYKNQQQ